MTENRYTDPSELHPVINPYDGRPCMCGATFRGPTIDVRHGRPIIEGEAFDSARSVLPWRDGDPLADMIALRNNPGMLDRAR